MKIEPKAIAKFAGLTAGALFGGPVFGPLGASCGEFIGDLMGNEQSEDHQDQDLGVTEGLKGIFGNLLASKMEPWLAEPRAEFSHELRQAAAASLLQAMEWKGGSGALALALRKQNYFRELSEQRRELLGRLIEKWRKHLRGKPSSVLDALMLSGGDEMLTDLADADYSADEASAKVMKTAWEGFYDRMLQPVVDDITNEDERMQFDPVILKSGVAACLATVFPKAFIRVVLGGERSQPWRAYQRVLLKAIQKSVHVMGVQMKGVIEMEKKLDALLDRETAQAELEERLDLFLCTVDVKLDGTFNNTEVIIRLILEGRRSMDGTLSQIQGGVGHIQGDMGDIKMDMGELRKALGEMSQKLDYVRPPSALKQYRDNLLSRFSKHNSLGIPAVEDTTQQQGPDMIVDLFVEPTCTVGRVRPEDMPAVLGDHKRRPQPLLPRLNAGERVVLLADPGMGKSTLIQWLVVTRALSLKDKITPDEAIPLPFILRDIVPLLPTRLEEWSWKSLLKAFLQHQHDKEKPGMAKPLSDDAAAVQEILDSPQAWFLIDGLDEVGDKTRRMALRRAIWEGFEAHPKARFLITSRVVGYDEAEVHVFVEQKRTNVDKMVVMLELAQLYGRMPAANSIRLAKLLHLAPWQDAQQEAFASHWFKLRLGESDGPVRARDFVRAVHDHPSTRSIGRVPNLLLLMALLYRYRADLPHGRAKVYAGISQAYLENISVVRRIPHRADLPYTLAQKERLLAVIAMHMQVRPAAAGSSDAGKSKDKDDDDVREVLASRKDLENWLCLEFGRKTDVENVKEMETFLAHIADSSGLLLPRGVVNGVEQFAFAHLSFQEYYAACWLELEFSRLLNKHAGGDDLLDVSVPAYLQRPELAMTETLYAKYAADPSWREPLLFLAEKVSDRPPDMLTLRKWLFPVRRDDRKPLPIPTQQLLATLSLDPQVSFVRPQREAIWKYLCEAHVQNETPWKGSVAPSLLVSSDDQAAILTTLVRMAAQTENGILDLSGCVDINNLESLRGMSALQELYLNGCTNVGSLEVLRGLTNLREFFLNGCTGVQDLRPLKDLNLITLSVRGCTGLVDLKGVSGMRRLRVLYLAGCTQLTDLDALKELSQLRFLFLNGCTGLRDREGVVQDLKNALPELQIIGP